MGNDLKKIKKIKEKKLKKSYEGLEGKTGEKAKELKKEVVGHKQAEEELRKLTKHLERQKETIEKIFKFVPEGLLVYSNKLNLFKENVAFNNIIKKYAKQLNYSEQELKEIILEQVKNKLASGDKELLRISKKKV